MACITPPFGSETCQVRMVINNGPSLNNKGASDNIRSTFIKRFYYITAG